MSKGYLFPVFSAILLVFSFPPFDLYPLAWFAFLPLLWAIKDATPQVSFLRGIITGSLFFLGILYWTLYAMVDYGGLSLLWGLCLLCLLVTYLALYFGIFCYTIKQLALIENPVFPWFASIFWVGLEYVRGHFLTGFPWELLGDSQYKWLHFIQMADIGGVYLLSFFVILGNACLFQCLFQKTKVAYLNLLILLLLLGLGLLYGHNRLAFWGKKLANNPQLKIAVIQGNIDQAHKWDPVYQEATIKIYETLTKAASRQKPDLVIWPETALPFYLQLESPYRKQILKLARGTNSSLLVGSPAYEMTQTEVKYYNRAYLINKKGIIISHYDKTHLVPFGEYVPCRKLFSFIPMLANNPGDFSPGKSEMPLRFQPGVSFGVLICFECIFPEISQKLVKRQANFLVNITNDAWFGYTSAPYQHLSMLVLRAVENRRAIARAANTGISAFIDPTGQIFKKTKLFTPAYLVGKLPLIKVKTVYTMYGDTLAFGCLCGMFILSGIYVGRRFLWKKLKKV
ncbi:MAG: apolipoprotein N-acyltransferase [Candidatus Desulfofervidaceae bacterium]|nr:apolipoprotein N-acyltransferase [Candidatus Desulfofervidaceae bacterium]MDL1970534.1 apolipoprotein N-acyltransferase [Candidatus Desulfofervidaceae bacterium]